jgi:methionyl-tRNA synthetase
MTSNHKQGGHTPNKPYPQWVCQTCGSYAAQGKHKNNYSTYHEGTCEVCGHFKSITEPRDFGYPKFIGFENHD